MNKKPLILICNDDGIHARGLYLLAQALHQANIGRLAIVAPSDERSGTGVSITWNAPLTIKKCAFEHDIAAWSVSGNPADCVKVGLKILQEKPDMIVSGINPGSNAGHNVLYSGTVGAVIEGAMRGIQGVAFSCERSDQPMFEIAQQQVALVTQYLLDNPLATGSFLNVNFPHTLSIKGFKFTRQGKGRCVEHPDLHIHHGDLYSYVARQQHEDIEEEHESDVLLLKQGYSVAVPICIKEFTNIHELQERKEKFEQIFSNN